MLGFCSTFSYSSAGGRSSDLSGLGVAVVNHDGHFFQVAGRDPPAELVDLPQQNSGHHRPGEAQVPGSDGREGQRGQPQLLSLLQTGSDDVC